MLLHRSENTKPTALATGGMYKQAERNTRMLLELQVTPRQLQVALSGCIYAEESVTVRERLLDYIARGHTLISIDLSGVDYIDCSGLGTLVFINEQAREKGGLVKITGLDGRIKHLFELTQLNIIFNIT